MDVSTRPSHQHRQGSAHTRRALAVFLSLLLSSASVTQAAPSPDDIVEPATTESIATDTSHEVAISVVEPGQESISLAARLTTVSVGIARDVTWQVRNSQGELIVDTTANEVTSPLAPGEYTVEAQYGAVAVRETVRVIEGNSIHVNFILNAGGLRVMPGLHNLPVGALPHKTMVYALSGIEKGKLVAHSDQPGELLKVPAGMYRVESRIGVGNVSAVSDVRVRPGKMSAVEVVHNVGLARLNFVGSPEANVVWEVWPVDGQKIATLQGITHSIALKPGVYLAEARVNGEVLTAQFKIDVGMQRDIMLGN